MLACLVTVRARLAEWVAHLTEPSTGSLEAGCTNLEFELLVRAKREMGESWNQMRRNLQQRMVWAGEDEFRRYPMPFSPSAFDQQTPSGPTRHLT